MIEKIKIHGYRKFKDLTVTPNAGINILVGDNESGKSSLIEAITLALTGRINGRSAQEELNPHWFNHELLESFFQSRQQGNRCAAPTISIELFLKDLDELQKLNGANNSEVPTAACPGLRLTVEPNPEYLEEIEAHFATTSKLVPVDYYQIVWRSFADIDLTLKPRVISSATIDSRTIRTSSGVDYHLQQILSEHIEPAEKASIGSAYRGVKESMTDEHLKVINSKIANLDSALNSETISLAMDQSSRNSWESIVVPYVDGVPFAMSGLGQQVTAKISLAMSRSVGSKKIVMIEEPENHLSHTSLNKLIFRISKLADPAQQLFISTHNSFVLNRLGLDSLLLISNGIVRQFAEISKETTEYFQKLPGFNTLRVVLAAKVVVVEGPSDEIVFERFYVDTFQKRPMDDGIDVISMGSVSPSRYLELCHVLLKDCAAIRDNDGTEAQNIVAPLLHYLDEAHRRIFFGASGAGNSLEQQIAGCNDELTLRSVLGLGEDVDLERWMVSNKTETAIRIATSSISLNIPSYLKEAIEFIHHD